MHQHNIADFGKELEEDFLPPHHPQDDEPAVGFTNGRTLKQAGYDNVVSHERNLGWAAEVRRRKFHTWNEAQVAGYRSRSQWRREGFGIKGRSLAFIHWRGREILLYHEDQTTRLTDRTKATDRLLDRFVVRTDICGYQPHRTDEWRQMRGDGWRLKELARQSFNHVRCFEQGIPLGRHLRAQAFSVRCGPRTNFFVIDVDNHTPSPKNIPAHLELVNLVQTELANLIGRLGGGSLFYQYRQPDPTGIQFWITLLWRPKTDVLHRQVRDFLLGLEQKSPGLNDRLRQAGLATLDKIEISPTENVPVSMPGCFGKTVFTAHELRLVKGRFDVEALDEHIRSNATNGDVLPRYGGLMEVCWGNDFAPAGGEVSSDESPTNDTPAPAILTLDSLLADGKRYWTDLKLTALHGISTADNLYEDYLQPMAQCLFFRDFVREPDRERLVEDELFNWLMAKHNGFVSRVLSGKTKELRHQCRHVAKNIEKKTCRAVKSYYQFILENDVIYPHRVEHLYEYMRQNTNGESEREQGKAEAKWNNLSLIYCKCSISHSNDLPFDESPLPTTIAEKVSEIAGNMRTGAVTQRFMRFACRFLNEIASGEGGERSISWRRINGMLDKPDLENRQTQVRYKKRLVAAGLIRGDWEKFARRNAASSKYRLTEWAYKEFQRERRWADAESA